MKKAILISIILASACLACAYPVRISSWNPAADAKTLNSLNISVSSVSVISNAIHADVRDDSEFDRLLANGFNAVKLPDTAREYALRLQQDRSLDPPRDEYYTNAQYNQFMQDIAAQYPNICSLVQAGTSVQGRPLYFLKITDNPGQQEAEPEFKYISSIHGNEVVGYDMCIRLIQLLTSGYGSNARITDLVNGTEIWICPMMNPDGFVLGQRQNANGIDLNRNFPMPTGVQHPDGNAWALENVAIMDLLDDHSYVLSANFHGGALVVNYPWDYTYVLAPDNDLLIQGALAYSTPNQPMYNSNEFPQGITNGAAWYVITGSMQDWNYGFTDCIDMTMEIGTDMWPPASALPTFWSQNQESMLAYMEFAHRGIHGLVTSSSGSPLDATIIVQGNAKDVHTDPDAGDYHRLLLPGTYTLTAEAYGYIPQTAQISVPLTGSAEHNFVLQPAGQVTFHGQARDPQGFGLGGLQVSVDTEPVSIATTDASGSFQFDGVYEGNYRVTFSQGTEQLWSADFSLSSEENRHVFVISDPMLLLNDPCNDIANWTATTPWGVVQYQGESVIADSPTGNYANHINKALRLTNPISLQNIIDPKLTFKTVYDLESGYDFVNVQASTTLSNWTTLGSLTGTQSSWQALSYSLEQFAGQSVYVRFVIETDWNVTADGIYLDDIVISGIDASQPVYGDVDGNGCVSRSDIQYLLDFVVGFDPLPEIDPLPWEAGRVAASDVDLNLNLNSADAYLIQRYILESNFRFEAQSGEEAVFTPVTVTPILLANSPAIHYCLTFSPQSQLRCFDFQLSPSDQINLTGLELIPELGMASSNSLENRFAWISPGTLSLEELHLHYQSDQYTAFLNYTANGGEGVLELPAGTASDDPSVPAPVFKLAQNSPNPFRTTTSITFSLAKDGLPGSIRIYNARGQLIRTLADGILPHGEQRAVWDGRDESGAPVGNGVYLCRLQSGEESISRKMILLK